MFYHFPKKNTGSDPAYAEQLRAAAIAGDAAMKGEEAAIYHRYATGCPGLVEIAKKIVFLEERQPAIDKFAEGNPMLHSEQTDMDQFLDLESGIQDICRCRFTLTLSSTFLI